MPELEVLHVIHSGAVGGGPQVVLDLAGAIPGRHTVACAEDGPLLSDARARGLGAISLRWAGKYSFGLSVRTVARAARHADLVHLHGQFAGMYGTLAARLAGRPALYTAHFPSFVTDSNWRNKTRNRVAEAISCRLSTLAVSCSETMRQEYLRRGLTSPDRMITICNGVREVPGDGRRARADLGIAPDTPLLVAVGRLSRQKGFDLLLAAVPEIARYCPAVRLAVVGDGEERSALESQAQRSGASSAVLFTGFRSDTADLMAAANLVVVPSRYDVFPLVPLEAMMLGRPVAATDLPVLREALGDQEASAFFAPEPASLARTISALLADPEHLARLGSAGRARARERFTVERMASEYYEAYLQCLHRDR